MSLLFLLVSGHVSNWRQKIARTESQTGEVRADTLQHVVKQTERWRTSAVAWSSNLTIVASFSFLQRKRVGQSHHQEGGRWAHRKFHAVSMSSILLKSDVLRCHALLLPGRCRRWRSRGSWQSAVWGNTWGTWWKLWWLWPTERGRCSHSGLLHFIMTTHVNWTLWWNICHLSPNPLPAPFFNF